MSVRPRSPWFVALLAIPVSFALVACGSQSPSSTAGPTPTASAKAAKATATGGPASEAPEPTGNGIEKLRGKDLLERVVQASSAAKSVRIKGAMKDGKSSITFNLAVSGENVARGTIGLDEAKMEIIRIGKDIYIKANEAFYGEENTDPETMKELTSKYLKGTTDEKDLADIVDLTNLDTIFKDFLPDGPTLVLKGDRKQVNGRAALRLGDLTDAALWVATEGEPHILRVEAGKEGTLDFLDYGEPVSAKPPAKKDILETE